MTGSTLRSLLELHPIAAEEPQTAAIIRRLKSARKRGYMTRAEFLLACNWKSPRARRHFASNTTASIRAATAVALASRSERSRFDALTALSGVGAPMASALLTLTNPKRYGVIDIRVWKLLHRLGSVTGCRNGVGFEFRQWYAYIVVLRHHARRLGVDARSVERTLFLHHRRYARGSLYRVTS